MRAVAPRAAIARFATHRSAILRAQFLMRPVDMDKVVAFGGSQRVLGKCCIWLTRMQAMRMRLNQRWFDSRAVQATLALCVALLPEPSPEQLRYCWSCCSILALCAAPRARAPRAAARAATQTSMVRFSSGAGHARAVRRAAAGADAGAAMFQCRDRSVVL